MSLLQPEPSWNDVSRGLHKFNKEQLLTLPQNLDSIFDVTDPNFDQDCRPNARMLKYDMVSAYIRHLKRNTDCWSAVTHLNLLKTKYNTSRRVWKIYRGNPIIDDEGRSLDEGRSPDEIMDQLKDKLSPTHKSEIAVQLHDGAYWIHVAIKPKRARLLAAASMIYIVHYARTSCFASVNMTVKLRNVVCMAMEAVFGLEDVDITALQDRNLDSLFQLQACTKFPEQFMERGIENTPPLEEEPIHDYDPRIIDRQAIEKAERRLAFKRKFGWEKAPPITKLTYQLHTAFGGVIHAPNLLNVSTAPLIESRVVIDGVDVLNGIQEIVKAGISTGRLPKHLTDVRTLGRTQFLIRQHATNAP